MEVINIEMVRVQSSDLHSVGYDNIAKILHIKFLSGGLYEYSLVPQSIHTGLMNASSKGIYFHQNIKNRYPTRKLN